MRKLIDRNYETLRPQEDVTFFPRVGRPRNGVVVGKDSLDKDRVSVLLLGDPFPTGILPANLQKGHDQLKGTKETKKMAEEQIDRKALRKAAKAKGIDGWESMTTSELQAALGKGNAKKSKKTKAKKEKAKKTGAVSKAPTGKTKADKGEPVTPSQKAKAKKSTTTKKAKAVADDDDGDPIPFRKGSKSYIMAKLLVKGGTVRKMIDTLSAKVELNPYKKKVKKLDPDFEWNKRILITATAMEKAGFTIVKTGRGPDNATMKAYPPGVKLGKGEAPRVKQGNSAEAQAKKKAKSAKPATTKKTAKSKKVVDKTGTKTKSKAKASSSKKTKKGKKLAKAA